MALDVSLQWAAAVEIVAFWQEEEDDEDWDDDESMRRALDVQCTCLVTVFI